MATDVRFLCNTTPLLVCLLIINYLHSKNYRKPLLQRYVVRILLMYRVPALRILCSMLSCAQGPHILDCFLGQHGLPDSRRLS